MLESDTSKSYVCPLVSGIRGCVTPSITNSPLFTVTVIIGMKLPFSNLPIMGAFPLKVPSPVIPSATVLIVPLLVIVPSELLSIVPLLLIVPLFSIVPKLLIVPPSVLMIVFALVIFNLPLPTIFNVPPFSIMICLSELAEYVRILSIFNAPPSFIVIAPVYVRGSC